MRADVVIADIGIPGDVFDQLDGPHRPLLEEGELRELLGIGLLGGQIGHDLAQLFAQQRFRFRNPVFRQVRE